MYKIPLIGSQCDRVGVILQHMEKRTRPFFDRFTATQDRPLSFQVVTMVLVSIILLLALSCLIARLF